MIKSLVIVCIVGTLAACASRPAQNPQPPQGAPVVTVTPTPVPTPPATVPGGAATAPGGASAGAAGTVITQARSRWVPALWRDLPGWDTDAVSEAWAAWLKSCDKPSTAMAVVCPSVRLLGNASAAEQREWMLRSLQPYKVEPLLTGPAAKSEGLLTGYYEPVLNATRNPTAANASALYRSPANLASKKPWYSRKDIDTLPEAKAALQGRAIAYVADPVDALVLQIQGSGRVRITEPDGSQKTVRLAFAGTNDQPYKSVGRWLLDQNLIQDASWPGIKAWIVANPQRVQEMLWSNPRVVFFKEEALPALDAASGPRGAQGVPLTPGRSIAVDAGSIPYGAPVWLASAGPAVNLARLVVAQDTGTAIVGAVRADYYVGTGFEAGELAGRLKQPLSLWVLWPR